MKEPFKLSGIGRRILLFAIVAAVLTMLLSVAASFLILREVLPAERIALYSNVIGSTAVGVACAAACGKQDAGILPTCLGVASVYFAMVLLAKTILFPGAAEGLLPRALGIYGAAFVFALILTLRKKGRGPYRRAARR